MVHYALTPGGATLVAIDYALALKRQGFQAGFASDKGQWQGRLAGGQIQFHRLYFLDPERYSPWVRYGLGMPLTIVALLYLVWRYQYGCICVHHQQSSLPAAFVARLTGAVYVFCAHIDFRSGRHLACPGRHVIAVSQAVKEKYMTKFGLPSDVITVLPNAVETNVGSVSKECVAAFEERWNIDPQAPVVACVALLNEQKAHHILLKAWQRVSVEFPQAVLVLAGGGPLRAQLEQQCSRLEISQNVRFLRMVDDVSVVYWRANFMVLSSISEGMPLVALEAAVYGRPIVATAVGGTPEVVLDEQTGLLVELNNPDQLAKAINRLLGDSEYCRLLGANARNFVQEKYSPTARAVVLGDYFRGLIK
jgi:glycosyltransferase involved in cell wall biosynthesis